VLSLFAAAVFAVDTGYKTKIITSAPQTIRVKDGQIITIKNFTQDQDSGNGRGVIDAGLPPPSPTPTPTIPVPTPTPTPNSTDLTATKSDDVSGHATVSPWTWTIRIANGGAVAATFTSGQIILTDNLPNTNVTYGSLQVTNLNGITTVGATINCAIDASDTLTCTVSGTSVTIAGGGSFDVSIRATPTAAGTFINPSPAGVCAVDPGNVITESDESNNTCFDTVISTNTTPTPTPTPTATASPIKAGVLTAALPGEYIKPLVIAGPATLTIDPVSGATLAITYKKSLQLIQATPTPTASP
jgi:hypothetical protein